MQDSGPSKVFWRNGVNHLRNPRREDRDSREMANSQRLKGLELLRFIGAPVPNWQIVQSIFDINSLNFTQTKFGWTIRTCRKDGRREMGLFYLNNASNTDVLSVLKERLTKFSDIEFYIVYPSWSFRFSCNIVLRNQTYNIEGKYGSQKSLSAGKTIPDFGLQIPFGLRSEMTCYVGKPTEEVLSWIGQILFWCKRIPKDSFYAEVALIQTPELIFYELFSLEDQASPF